MLPDTLTSAYIMLHRRHARQHRPERLQRRHFSRQLSVRQRRRASASSSDAKIPSAEAARAAPVSFKALPRVMASLSRAIASSSKEAAPPWSLLVSNADPPFELPLAHPFAEHLLHIYAPIAPIRCLIHGRLIHKTYSPGSTGQETVGSTGPGSP